LTRGFAALESEQSQRAQGTVSESPPSSPPSAAESKFLSLFQGSGAQAVQKRQRRRAGRNGPDQRHGPWDSDRSGRWRRPMRHGKALHFGCRNLLQLPHHQVLGPRYPV